MRNLHSSALCAGFALAATMSLSSAANAVAFVNGGFEAQGYPGATCVTGTPTGWTGGAFRCGAGYHSAAPPEGSVFELIGGGLEDPGGALSQTLTGLSIGQAYRVSFSIGGEDCVIPGFVEQVTASMLSGSTSPSQTYSAPTSSNAGGCGVLWDHWAAVTYDFTANATSADIQFQQIFSASGDTGIDNVSIAARVVGGVPEPATLALFGAGLAGLGAMRRRKARKST